jgi:tetratricopeptide (TPR) repeat protein
MKHSRVSPPLSLPLSLLVCGLTVLSAAAVRAAECPASSPDRTDERRALAKEWFARAEAAENAGNDVEAVKAYACSMKMVAHAFTAYNLGRVAERSGDLELALRSYKAYLTLKADAQDKDEVQAKITELEGKINQVKESIVGGEPATTEPATGEEKPEVAVEPEPPKEKVEKPLPIEPPPHVTQPVPEARQSSHIAEWVVGGAAVAIFAAAWIPNFMARSDMNKANSATDYNTANSSWNSAKSEAYWSYALFGIAGAAAAVEAVLLYRLYSSGSSSSSDDTSVGMGWTPGGLTLSARGRF